MAENSGEKHLVLANHAYDTACATADSLVDRFASLTGWVEALRDNGWRVSVVQRFHSDARFDRAGVEYHFVADRFASIPRMWQVPTRLHRTVARLDASAVHFNGLIFPVSLYDLARRLPGTPVVAQHHAERPWRGWRRLVQKTGLSGAAGFFFVAGEQAQQFRKAGLIRGDQPVFEVMEGSTPFSPRDRDQARRTTGLIGTPQFLWIGRLIPLKSPLVVLAGFARLVERYPTARLALIYHDASMLADVRAMIERTPALRRSVSMVGAVPHAMIETYLNSADYFVLGSTYEGSGYALAEAMACGVIPLVTDIPSFRMMTGNGEVGALWQVGDPVAMVSAAERLLLRDRSEESKRVREMFIRRLSYEAIGRAADAAYRSLVSKERAA